MVRACAAVVREENLVARLRVLEEAASLLVVAHAVSTPRACALLRLEGHSHSELKAEGVNKAVVYEAVAPCVAILLAVVDDLEIVQEGRELVPVVVTGVRGLVLKLGVCRLLEVPVL